MEKEKKKVMGFCKPMDNVTETVSIKDYLDVDLRDIETLSKREFEILEMVSLGLSNREISKMKFLSYTTTQTHVRNLMEKLSAPNRTAAGRMLWEWKQIT